MTKNEIKFLIEESLKVARVKLQKARGKTNYQLTLNRCVTLAEMLRAVERHGDHNISEFCDAYSADLLDY